MMRNCRLWLVSRVSSPGTTNEMSEISSQIDLSKHEAVVFMQKYVSTTNHESRVTDYETAKTVF